MSERVRFIARVEDGETIADLAREFGISEKTAYKFLARWKRDGVRGLEDQSHAVERIPHRTPQEIIDLVLAMRREYPSRGGISLKARLERRHPGLKFPSAPTIHSWLTKHGLVEKRARRVVHPRTPTQLTTATAPNHVWATDFKGEFRLGNGSLCYPLTVTDLSTRFIVGCDGLESTKASPSWEVFERLFEEHGLPTIIRSDNGPPFATRGLASLSKLSVRWMRLGIKPERIKPSHPEQNGQHERMHRTLKQETTRPSGKNLLQQQERFDAFVEDFNQERPHRAIDLKVPADLYAKSARKYEGLPELTYPLADDVRTVGASGTISLPGNNACKLTRALTGEKVGIRELDEDRWLVSFATLDLGVFDSKAKRFIATDFSAPENRPEPATQAG